MSPSKSDYSDEIDILKIFSILLRYKWLIILITLLSVLVGITLFNNKENSFTVSTSIYPGSKSIFINYMSINDVLEENGLRENFENPNGYSIDRERMLNNFINEFNDYEEMIIVLNKNDFVKQSLNNLDENEKNQILIDYAKSFSLTLPSEDDKINDTLYANIVFNWHNVDEGSDLINKAIIMTLENVQKNLFYDLNSIALSIDYKNERKLESLRNEVNILKQQQELANAKRLQYLKEQSAIAKELGIAENQLEANSFKHSAFYLRGYKAIDKEISIIIKRSEEENLLTASGYDEINKEIISIQNDLSSSQLRNALNLINNNKSEQFIKYNLSLADIKSQKNFNLYFAVSVFLGLILGMIAALFFNSYKKS